LRRQRHRHQRREGRLTGRKRDRQVYYWHTGHPGGIKERTAARSSKAASRSASSRRPSSACSARPAGPPADGNLRVYAGAEHPHEAQQPEKLDVAAMNRKNTRSG
jgi:large subunit ribosomal protein L13